MTDAKGYLANGGLYDLKAAGMSAVNTARRNGEDTTWPLVFAGSVTVAIGAKMIWDAFKRRRGDGGQMAGRSR